AALSFLLVNGVLLFGVSKIFFLEAIHRIPVTKVIALGCAKVGEPKPDENEFLEVVLVPLTEWVGMLSNDVVRDPKTIATTMLALFYLGASVGLPSPK
ncbi:MAG: hypothetical protein G01um101491_277, partial [Parcubacteria group bacterium Gr01-1014_91]